MVCENFPLFFPPPKLLSIRPNLRTKEWKPFFTGDFLLMSLAVSPAQLLDPAARAIVHHTCFKVSRKINQSDVLAKFCPTFLMTMIRHETGPFYRRPSGYVASLGEQTLTHQRYRERL